MKKTILAIETSCDETSMAIVSNGKILAHVINSQASFFETLGGVVPEMASRMHEENIHTVFLEVLKRAKLNMDNITHVAVTYGPGLVGPLLIGVNFANSLKLLYNVKLVAVNHMQAHIKAITIENNISYPHLSLIVSGGHTEIVYLSDKHSYKIIGQTLDDAVGESFDKVARMLEIGYPGGPKIDHLSKQGVNCYKMPSLMDDGSYDFSFSGIKSHCYNLINQMNMKSQIINKADFACSFQEAVVSILVKKFRCALSEYKPSSCSVVGGVSANSRLKNVIQKEVPDCMFASSIYCTDNAAMVGICAMELEDCMKAINANPSIDVEAKCTT